MPSGSRRASVSPGAGPVNHDYRDSFAACNAHGVEYLVGGAHTPAVHGHVRAIKDCDAWVRPDPENAMRALGALTACGAPIRGLTEANLAER